MRRSAQILALSLAGMVTLTMTGVMFAQAPRPVVAAAATDNSRDTQLLISHALGMAISGAELHFAAHSGSEDKAKPEGEPAPGGPESISAQLHQQSAQQFGDSNHMLRSSYNVVSSSAPGEDRNAGARRFYTVASKYAATLRMLAKEDPANPSATPSNLSGSDLASITLINHAVCEALEAFELRQLTQLLDSSRGGVRTAESQQLQAHAQQMAANGDRILQQAMTSMNRPAAAAPADQPKEKPEPANPPKENAETPKDAAPDAPKDAAPDAPKDAAPDAPKDTAADAPKDTAVAAPKDDADAQPADNAELEPQEKAADAPKDASVDAPKDAPADAPKDAPADAPKDAPADAPKEAPADAPKEAPADAPKEAPADAPKETPKENAADLPKENANEAGAQQPNPALRTLATQAQEVIQTLQTLNNLQAAPGVGVAPGVGSVNPEAGATLPRARTLVPRPGATAAPARPPTIAPRPGARVPGPGAATPRPGAAAPAAGSAAPGATVP